MLFVLVVTTSVFVRFVVTSVFVVLFGRFVDVGTLAAGHDARVLLLSGLRGFVGGGCVLMVAVVMRVEFFPQQLARGGVEEDLFGWGGVFVLDEEERLLVGLLLRSWQDFGRRRTAARSGPRLPCSFPTSSLVGRTADRNRSSAHRTANSNVPQMNHLRLAHRPSLTPVSAAHAECHSGVVPAHCSRLGSSSGVLSSSPPIRRRPGPWPTALLNESDCGRRGVPTA